jgi:hypothetical protein
MPQELSDEELDAFIEQELQARSPEGQAQQIIEEAQVEASIKELNEEIDRRIEYLTCRGELKYMPMSQQPFAERIRKIVLILRDSEKVSDEASPDFVAGYEKALTDFATFLTEEFHLDT